MRAGYGIYYDRGELFSYFSPSAGSGFNGPFGVTLAPPFVEPIAATGERAFRRRSAPRHRRRPHGNAAGFPRLFAQPLANRIGPYWPSGNLFGPFLFGGYDISNKLPYTQNWTLDFQYQLSNNWLFDVGYVGNHGRRSAAHSLQPAAPRHAVRIRYGQNPATDLFLRWPEPAGSACNCQ